MRFLLAQALALLVALSAHAGFELHSHNDFARNRPLLDAIDAGITSVEVDVIDRWNQVRVTHLGFLTDGTLKEVYLDPLQEQVNRKGSVHGDGKPFHLWIELRGMFTGPKIVPLLRELLSGYPMLARYRSDGTVEKPGPVIAIISGYSDEKHRYFEGQAVTPAVLALNDREFEKRKADPRAHWISTRWSRHSEWEGAGKAPDAAREKVSELAGRVHAAGRKVRIWGNPETAEFWSLMLDSGIDQASTDLLGTSARQVRELSQQRKGSG